MTIHIGLDFETYGSVDLPSHGMARYTRDKCFMPLIGSVAWDEGQDILTHRLDFVYERGQSRRELQDIIGGAQIVAHNAPFEERVLCHLGLDYPSTRFVDSAVVARIAGAGSRLEAAAPQLLASTSWRRARISSSCSPSRAGTRRRTATCCSTRG